MGKRFGKEFREKSPRKGSLADKQAAELVIYRFQQGKIDPRRVRHAFRLTSAATRSI